VIVGETDVSRAGQTVWDGILTLQWRNGSITRCGVRMRQIESGGTLIFRHRGMIKEVALDAGMTTALGLAVHEDEPSPPGIPAQP
jgi:hypothetical protein